MRRRRSGRIPGLLGDASDVLTVLTPGVDADDVARAGLPPGGDQWSLSDPPPHPRPHDAVVLLARDLADLRRAATAISVVGSARTVGVRFTRTVPRLPTVAPRPSWELEELWAVRRPDSWVLLRFAEPLPARQVLLDVARAAVPAGRLSVGWPALGVRRGHPELWPPADPGAKVAVLDRLLDQGGDFPPDLALLDRTVADRVVAPDQSHHVLGRPSAVTFVEPDLSWEDWRALPEAEAARALGARGPRSLGPVDEHAHNPIGFERDPEGGTGALGQVVPDGSDRHVVRLPVGGPLDDATVDAARALRGVRLTWAGGQGPQDYCRRVLGLAAIGTPLIAGEVPGWARSLLPPPLVDVLERPPDLDDRLGREEHSVRLRRAALTSSATPAWRNALARERGLQEVEPPRVSVLLATRRPDMLPFALRQVVRQRGAGQLQVVLAPHGFDPDPVDLEAVEKADHLDLVVLPAAADEPFGAVLNRAASAADGDLLLKMDDDDWYGPDFVADLLLARAYSGAEVTGCSAEFTFLHELALTTRQALPTEVYRPLVAGGTLLVERATFRALGGFRRTARYVDAGLLGAVRDAGGRTYRTHGLGYVLRRAASGHTWDPGVGYFLTAERAAEQWRGFRPSALLEPDDEDLPADHRRDVP